MAYLEPADYANYGLPAGTTADWITAATALINSYCRRPDLNVIQYTERLRVTTGAQTVLLSYLATGTAGTGDYADCEPARPLRQAAARRTLAGAAERDRVGVFAARAMDGDRSNAGGF